MGDDARRCPCSSGRPLAACCAPVIAGADAATAEALMRSRYTAYVLGEWDYLRRSWHPDTRPSRVSSTNTEWLGLTIVASSETSVEFIAGFREQGRVMALHETSRFARDGGRWRYIDGVCDVHPVVPNEPCPCGSGKKSKRCCART